MGAGAGIAERLGVRSRLAVILILPLLSLVLAPAAVRADAPGLTPAGGHLLQQPPPPPIGYRTESYRLHLLAADVGALGVGVLGGITHNESLGSIAGLGIFTFAPAMHIAHGNYRGALRSLVFRVGLPVAGAMAGLILYDAPHAREDEDGGGFIPFGEGSLIGLGVGFASAIAIDYIWIAEQDVPVTSGESWGPTVSVSPHGASVGLLGRF